MAYLLILLVIVSTFVLIKAADAVVIAIRRISRKSVGSTLAIASVVLALGTSFPELFVSITSAIQGKSEIALGAVTGSNIANISLVAGLAAFVVGKVFVYQVELKKEFMAALAAGSIPMILMADGRLGRVDGLILLSIYFAFATSFFRDWFLEIAKQQSLESYFYRFIRRFNHVESKKKKEYGRLFVGIAVMLLSSDLIVRATSIIAKSLGVGDFLIGLVLIAIGTSLPELVFSFRSLEKRQPKMFFGNLLGSTVVNSTLVVGVAALIFPIDGISINKYGISIAAFLVIYSTFWFFVKSKNVLVRWEALTLLIMYAIFVLLEFM